ncbi:MAG TPA: thioesterase family protein, partial [Magnetospirillaceae bacterium]|nr:thioesterase family protein [Magnetospirillaceae bacterium]
YECDAYGHVNNANYLHYLEVARGELLNAIGLDYRGLIAAGYGLYVTKVCIEFKSPAFMEEELTIESETVRSRKVSGRMRQVVRRGDAVLAVAELDWGFVNSEGRPTKMPYEFDLTRLTAEADARAEAQAS